MRATFSSKADTLKSLMPLVRSAKIAPISVIMSYEWMADSAYCLNKINDELPKVSRFIVRSSCSSEDTSVSSNAGAYLSLLNVRPEELPEAITSVIDSYHGNGNEQILIQPMLNQVIRSGVAFTHDPTTCSPYHLINWDEGEDTSFVTSGQGGRCWQGAAVMPDCITIPKEISSVRKLLLELEMLFSQPLDCEFAVTADESLWLLQVRPLVLREAPQNKERQSHLLKLIEDRLEKGFCHHPFLMGERTVFGVMPDWNPAEIIGIRPKPLALSLYRELVTDSIWAYQRHNYGYRNLRSFPLMPHLFGLPYIDVRLSFNSFIPADLDDELAGRLVDFYIKRLQSQPALHDKVEFEIVFSCYTPDLNERLQVLKAEGFSDEDVISISDSLKRLTNRVIDPSTGIWRSDEKKLKTLMERHEEIMSSNLDLAGKIYWLLEDAKRYGTLPFAGLARAGFMSVQILKSLVNVGILTSGDYDSFMSSLQTITSSLSLDRENFDKGYFLKKYGHLRPGTYDILSKRYDEDPDLYFDWNSEGKDCIELNRHFSLTIHQMRALRCLLTEHELKPNVVELFDFLQAGIELRELSKFHFTKNLSDALSLANELAMKYGFSREDIAFCDIRALQELHVAACDPLEILADAITRGKKRYKDTCSLSLPPLISEVEQIYSFEWPDILPNFITQKNIISEVAPTLDKERLNGRVVCIPNADPGFDWIFSYNISGLITAWGGVNSHMAIRAGELGIPAIIGAGERRFTMWSMAKCLEIDCAGKRVEVIC
ncbi:PEP/pyruvate-binding domain-containing protein [Aeromonas diversa]|uniref:PEP/pyruvate-binding domain-containing protein n=1 Tax=Aeromonas diversa TaxID=502790 RepID=UPI0005B8E11F|nr:PEP/pyruvate-binding domain-containing protein [Aeromonas diversa]